MNERPPEQQPRAERTSANPSRRSAVVRLPQLFILAFVTIRVATAYADGHRADSSRPFAALAKESPSWAVLRKAMQSRDYAVRLLTTQALGGIRSADVTAWIEHSLADPEHDVRVAAVDALDRIHTRRALDLLRSVRDDESESLDIRALAASALINHADE
jgi:HEAT repeat protein